MLLMGVKAIATVFKNPSLSFITVRILLFKEVNIIDFLGIIATMICGLGCMSIYRVFCIFLNLYFFNRLCKLVVDYAKDVKEEKT